MKIKRENKREVEVEETVLKYKKKKGSNSSTRRVSGFVAFESEKVL